MAAATGRVFEKFTATKGRSLFTKAAVSAGDILFEEEPLVCSQFSWNALCKYDACEYCMRSLETAQENARRLTKQPDLVLPHPECCEAHPECYVSCYQCGARYCCEKCRELASIRYHHSLCSGYNREQGDHPLQVLDSTWRSLHYPPETSSITLLTKLIAMVRQAENKQQLMSQISVFCNRSKDMESTTLHKLLGAEFSEGLEMLREMLSNLFEDVVPEWLTPDGLRSMFALIGTNGQGVGTSSLSVWVKNCDNLSLSGKARKDLDTFIDNVYQTIDEADKVYDEQGIEQECSQDAFLNCEGSALYITQSAANHSCLPNAEISFPYNNFVLRFTATQDIPADSEVFISYLNDCMLERSRHSRQKFLRENYLFLCDCVKCQSQSDDPDLTSDDDSEIDDGDNDVVDEDSMR